MNKPRQPSSPESYEDQSWYFYLTEIMLCKLEMRIDDFMQDKRRQAYRRSADSPEAFFTTLIQQVQEFDHLLKCYYESLPPAVQFSMDDLRPCSDELRHHLRLRVFSVWHDICLPAFYVLLHNDVSQWAQPLVTALIQKANVCLQLNVKFLHITITPHRQPTTWLVLRQGVRAALILIAAQRLASQHHPRLEALELPDKQTWSEGEIILAKGLEFWAEDFQECATYLNILRQIDPKFAHGHK